ncbi:MAG: WecB/TagA/CpsF family glycosyltransferase [Firmicutes bacterium]|nr:WecB/TagA/CpsF family glycosyltransferase [Bacillota bacterium]
MSGRVVIRGTALDNVDMDEALERFRGMLTSEGCSIIVTPNCEIIMAAEKDGELSDALTKAELSLPDGIGVKLAASALKTPLKQRLGGIDFCHEALKLCAREGISVFFLGGEEGVAEEASAALEKEIPGLRTAGARNGFFTPEEEQDIVRGINGSGAGFLVAGLGCPLQEKFLARHADELSAAAAIGVGGSMDVWSGRLKRAPGAMTALGLEWLFRLVQQPKRIGRTARIPVFLLRVIFDRRQQKW